MSEVLVKYDRALIAADGRAYVPRACGRQEPDGSWEGWIEFVPADGPVLRTPRETTQPKRSDLEYWATGLTHTYLEGALHRALQPARISTGEVGATPAFEGPAPSPVVVAAATAPPPHVRPALDPFEVYRQGERILQQQLLALDAANLRTIVREYDLVDEKRLDLLALDRLALVELITAAVRKRVE